MKSISAVVLREAIAILLKKAEGRRQMAFMNVWMGILTLHETKKNGEALYFFRQAP
ncbi:hypothetical protein H6G66_24875, partial [Fischerella sp. FACHB-380]|nr:hypothetical protein [Fischerella sp. FACHB-380]